MQLVGANIHWRLRRIHTEVNPADGLRGREKILRRSEATALRSLFRTDTFLYTQ